jgi:hypothetical protein
LGSLGAISSFGVDRSGELYLLIYGDGLSGRVLRIAPGGAAPATPTNLTALLNGRDVTLDWGGSTGAAQYRIEVGSRSGVTDILQFDTGSTLTALTATAVPDGLYYVRVRALNAAGASLPSNEITVAMGCMGPPPAPNGFTHTLSGRNVTLTWAATGVLTGILLEVGNGPLLSNVALIPLPQSARSLSGAVPPGTYYARLRGLNACGASEPSTELVVTVP